MLGEVADTIMTHAESQLQAVNANTNAGFETQSQKIDEVGKDVKTFMNMFEGKAPEGSSGLAGYSVRCNSITVQQALNRAFKHNAVDLNAEVAVDIANKIEEGTASSEEIKKMADGFK